MIAFAVANRLDLDRVQALLRTKFVGRTVWYQESTISTMEDAAREARAGGPEGGVAIAEDQSAGRGRMGRSWVSSPGENLHITIMVRPELAQLRHLVLITPLAVCLAIEELTALRPRIKWPNDVLIAGKKVCGVLAESALEDERVLFALVGVGINVNADMSAYGEIKDIATSLASETERELSREEVLAATLNHFETLYQALGRGEVVSIGWKERLETLGKQVTVQSSAGTLEGVAVDSDSDGALILRRQDGSHVRVEVGELAPG